jgi:hypothetical protein
MRLIHWVAGAVSCALLPAASRIEGSGLFAWTMYSRAGEYRIEVFATDVHGIVHRRNPTALAEHAAPSAAILLAGSDHWRPGPGLSTLRSHLMDLARYACLEDDATDVEVVLHERAADRAEHTTARRAQCGR